MPAVSTLHFVPHTFSSPSYELAHSWTSSNYTTTFYPRCHLTPSCKSTSQTLRTRGGPLTRQDSSASTVVSLSPKQTTSAFASFASNTTIRFQVIMGKAVHSTSSDANTHGQEYARMSRTTSSPALPVLTRRPHVIAPTVCSNNSPSLSNHGIPSPWIS